MKTFKHDRRRLRGKPRCPVCDTLIDGYTPVLRPDAIPREGDVSVCCYCATPLTVKGDRWVKLTGAALEEAMQGKIFAMVVSKVRERARGRRS